jgi:hypothetical protein
VQDFLYEPKNVRVGKFRFQDLEQYFMIYAREKLANIAGENVTKAASEASGAVEGFVRAFADAVCIRVENERLFEDRLDEIAQGVMNHAVAKRRGGDQPLFGIVDIKTVILPGRVRLCAKFALQFEQVVLQPILELCHIRMPALAPAGFAVGEEQVFPRTKNSIHNEGCPVSGPSPWLWTRKRGFSIFA